MLDSIDVTKLATQNFKSTLSRMLFVQPVASWLCIECRKSYLWTPYFHEAGEDQICSSDMRPACLNHWAECPECPVYPTGDYWPWWGEQKVKLLDKGTDITGWEMIEELARRHQSESMTGYEANDSEF